MEKKYFNLILLVLAVLQIFLLVSYIFAENYLISKTNSEKKVFEMNKKNQSSKNLFNFLVVLFSIKQIGIVSAEESGSACCFETRVGAICQDISSVDSPSCSPDKTYPAKCEDTDVCKQGCCISQDYGNCAPRSPKAKCESSNGIWKEDPECLMKECELGCCVIGKQTRMTTKAMCKNFGEALGFSGDWTANVPELECLLYSAVDEEGACIDNFGGCQRELKSECDGKFIKEFLCTALELRTRCKPTKDTICVEDEDKVYFVDSCGNKANVYDALKINDEDYWEEILEPTCGDDLGNLNSKDCGNCNYNLGSMCQEFDSREDATPNYGKNICKDLSCVDENGRERLNGESWCVYDGFVGEGKDPVGSRHWKRYCIEGEIKVEACEDYRGQVCTDREIERIGDGRKYSIAYCVLNEATNCLSYNQESSDDMLRLCQRNTHCELKKIDLGKGFKVEMCTPKYPRGFDLRSSSDNSALCSSASRKCDITYEKGFYADYKCVNNCECLEQGFVDKMNDLCISLGDCGSYVNYLGKGTESSQVIGDSDYKTSWRKYINFANPVPGQKVAEKNIEDVLSSFMGDVSDFTPEQMDKAAFDLSAEIIGATGGAVGLVGGALGGSVFGLIPVAVVSGVASSVLGAFGGAITGLVLGMYIGYIISVSLGLGDDATIGMVVSGAIGGAVTGWCAGVVLGTIQSSISAGLSVGTSVVSGFLSGPLAVSGASAAAISGSVPIVGWAVAAAIVIAMAITMIVISQSGQGKIKTETVEFKCLPWTAPLAGHDCSKCNDDSLKPCTKYRCESLGTSCQLIGEDTDNPKCEWINPLDSKPPEITAGEGNFTIGYNFFEETSSGIKLRTDDGECVRRFEQIFFQLKTDELAQCKWDYLKPIEKIDFDNFGTYGPDLNSFVENHTFVFFMMDLEALKIFNDSIDTSTIYDEIDMHIKCRDGNGNENEREYVVDVCVDKGPDLSPVDHSRTILLPKSGSYVAYGKTSMQVDMFIPEPAECRFSNQRNSPYDMMEEMQCSYGFGDANSLGWPCKANLTELTTGANDFYFKCKDKPWAEDAERNINQEDLTYSIFVSENTLEIVSTSPKGNLLRYNEPTSIDLEVKTIGGAPGADSICKYMWGGTWMAFNQIDEHTYVQKDLSLFSGNFNIPFDCTDTAGNKANGAISFQLEVDDEPPIVTRAYEEGSNLKIITNEKAKCYYDLSECNFDTTEDKKMSFDFSKTHFVVWDFTKTYYIKCIDEFENKNFGCAIIVNPQINLEWFQ